MSLTCCKFRKVDEMLLDVEGNPINIHREDSASKDVEG